MLIKTQLNRGLFPHHTSKQRMVRGNSTEAQRTDRNFTVPSHMELSGGSNNPMVVGSPTDSLSSYIAQLEDGSSSGKLPTDSQIEELLFNGTLQGSNTVNVTEAVQAMQNSRRNGSLDVGPTSALSAARGKRAWSEDRGGVNGFPPAPSAGASGMNRCGGFSGSAMGGFLLNGQNRQHDVKVSTLQRDLRPNGLDPRLEFARSRTAV